jgi:hypothetical protein
MGGIVLLVLEACCSLRYRALVDTIALAPWSNLREKLSPRAFTCGAPQVLFTHGRSSALSPKRPPGIPPASILFSVQVSLLFPLMSGEFALLIAIPVPVIIG